MSEEMKIKYEKPKTISFSGLKDGAGQAPCGMGSSAAICTPGTAGSTLCVPGPVLGSCIPGPTGSPI